MQESRLFKIIYYLLDKGQATAPELAEKLEVSVRTIYRDIDALSGAGIPVYAEAGRNGGIHLMKGFVLDKAILSEDEKQEILTALQSIQAAQSSDSSQTLQKLSAIFNLSSENWLEVDFSRWGNSGSDNEIFELLKSAIIRCKCVRIHYAGSYEVISERIVQPCKLSYKAKAWYLKAFRAGISRSPWILLRESIIKSSCVFQRKWRTVYMMNLIKTRCRGRRTEI